MPDNDLPLMFTCCVVKLILTAIQRRNDRLDLDLLVTDNNNFPLLLTFVYERTGSSTKDTEILLEPNSTKGIDTKCGTNVDESEAPKANDNNGVINKISDKEKVSEAIANKKEIEPITEEVSRL